MKNTASCKLRNITLNYYKFIINNATHDFE